MAEKNIHITTHNLDGETITYDEVSLLISASGSGLPEVSSRDNGKTLIVENGDWTIKQAQSPLVANVDYLTPNTASSTYQEKIGDLSTIRSNAAIAASLADWAKAANKPTYTASEVGALPSTTTHLSGDIASSEKGTANGVATLGSNGKVPTTQLPTHLSGDIAATEKGANNGVATLGSDGKIPSTQLPSYVDDVLEYSSLGNFPTTGVSGVIYVDTSANLTYRWSGTGYTEISPSISLGETSSTAFAGDRGKTLEDNVNAHLGETEDSTLFHLTAEQKQNLVNLFEAITVTVIS